MSPDQDRLLAEFVNQIRFNDLSSLDVNVAKAGILDCIGVMISGSQSKTVRYLAEELKLWGGVGNAVVIGHDEQVPAVWASLINGTAAHANHFDDMNPAIPGHPSCVLTPVLISTSSFRKFSGQNWIEAYACGFEIGVRLARAARPSLYSLGFHATSVIGVLMACSVASHLLRLSLTETRAALGISASLAAGVRANLGSMTQALHVGHATSQGLLATFLARRGFSSDPEAVTGRYGLLDCYTGGQYHCEEIENLGNPFELSRSGINFKFYPTGHPTICAIEATLSLRSTYTLSPQMVKEIHCFVSPWIKKTLNKNRMLTMGKEGKVNLPYCLAVALHRGHVVEADFKDEVLNDPEITRLRQCCYIHVVEDLPNNDEFPARVEIKLLDGRIVSEKRDRPSGSAINPPPWDRLIEKFRSQSAPVLGSARTENLITQLNALENIGDVSSLIENLHQ
jgi:2-methylcitrate dehydratase PrpD